MKTIYDGRIIIDVDENEDGKFIANIYYHDIATTSKKTNTEYAAIAEVMNEFKGQIINRVNK